MKRFFFFLAVCSAMPAFAAPGIHEALKDPAGVTVLRLSGEMNEAALLTKNGVRLTSLTHVVIANISDSIVAEQDIAAIAACPSVTKLTLENCGVRFLSGAVRMLVSVNEVEIVKCAKLDANQLFSTLAGMPGLKTLAYETKTLSSIPRSFSSLRFLERITIRNTDPSLADGYALNTSRPSELYATSTTQLGFGTGALIVTYGCYDSATAQAHATVMRDMLQGMVGTTGEMPVPRKAPAFDRKHPLVKQPIPGVEVHKSIYAADATAENVIEHPSGTHIFIPANAFVDATGAPVTGNVTIDYREYRDPVDILVSGIPMTYDSAGQVGNFESAGMFEINASVNGQEVFLAPGKKVDFEFAVTDTAANYNFYELDEEKGWVYQENLGKTDLPQNGNTAQEPDNMLALAWHNRTLADLRRKPHINDTTPFAARYSDLSYAYETRNPVFLSTDVKNYRNTSFLYLDKISSGKKKETCFVIRRRYRNRHNPELGIYRNMTWKTTDAVSAKEMRRLFRKRSGINDMRIYFDGSSYQLEFKTFKGFVTISAVPVRLVKGEYQEETPKIANARYRLYSRMLASREKGVQGAVRNQKRNFFRWQKKLSMDSVRHWNKLRSKMSDEEKKMTYREWVAFCAKQKFSNTTLSQQLAAAGMQYTARAYQRLSTFRFGIFNCDHTLPLPEPVQVFAVCKTPEGHAAPVETIYLLDKNRNMTISYRPDVPGPVAIAFSKRHDYLLFAIDKDGKLSFADAAAFSNRSSVDKNTCSFETVPISEQPVSVAELKAIMDQYK